MSIPTIRPPITNVDSTPIMAVGTVVWDPAAPNKAYKYVKFLDAVTYAAGQSVEYANLALTSVTNDRAGGSSLGRLPAGIATAVHTQNSYGFIQVAGVATDVKTSGADDIAVGEFVITHATGDGQCDGEASFGLGAFGVCIEADDNSANTTKVRLIGLL